MEFASKDFIKLTLKGRNAQGLEDCNGDFVTG